MSGTGKSSLVARLNSLGYRALDVDDEGWTRQAPDGGWVWREDVVGRVIREHTVGTLFLSGCAESQIAFYPDFDHVVLLSAPAAVIESRLRSRTNNHYGKRPDELAEVLRYLATVEPKLREAADHEVDATLPLDEVLRAVLELVDEGSPPSLSTGES